LGETMKTDTEFYEFLLCLYMGRKYMNEFTGGEIFHYTSPASFEKILFSKAEVELFASRYDCVNDTQEGKYIINIYGDVVEELHKAEKKISDEAYRTIRSILPGNEMLIPKYKGGECVRARNEKCDMYICCFSTDGDSLPMWNYYSKNDKYQGYSIGIEGQPAIDSLNSFLSGANVKWYEVVYDEQEQKDLIKNFLSELLEYYTPARKPSIQETIACQLNEWSMIFKNPCFEHEKEVRMVLYLPKDKEHEHYTIEYRQKDMFMIPFTRFHLSKDCVTSVRISPLYCTDGEKEQQIKILKERLNKEGYITEVIPSQIPIRY
jgi:hypothetical protein